MQGNYLRKESTVPALRPVYLRLLFTVGDYRLLDAVYFNQIPPSVEVQAKNRLVFLYPFSPGFAWRIGLGCI